MADAALVDRLVPGDHVCWTFADDLDRRRLIAAYVRIGLRDHHKVVYLTSALDADKAVAELRRERIDAPAALTSGRLLVACADDTYLASGAFDPEAAQAMFAAEVGRAREEGYAGLRALGDMAWAVWGKPGSEQLAGYERQVNRLYADGYAMAVCLYDQRLFAEPLLSELARAHPATVTPGTSRAWRSATAHRPPLRRPAAGRRGRPVQPRRPRHGPGPPARRLLRAGGHPGPDRPDLRRRDRLRADRRAGPGFGWPAAYRRCPALAAPAAVPAGRGGDPRPARRSDPGEMHHIRLTSRGPRAREVMA